MAADDGFLGIALAPLRQFFAVGPDNLLDDDLFNNLFSQHGGLSLIGAGGHDLFGLVITLNQSGGQGLRKFRPVTVQRIRLDPEAVGQFVSGQSLGNRGRVRHIDRLGDRTRDERLGRRHHVNMAVDRQIAFAGLAAGIGAIKHRIVMLFEVRRTFQRHRSANMVIAGVNLGFGEAQVAQQIKRRVGQLLGRDPQAALAEILAQGPLVEHKADIKSGGQCGLDLLNLTRTEAVADQRGVVDRRRLADRAMADRISHHFRNLGTGITQAFQGRRNRLVDDLEIAATGQFFELDQRKVRLNPCGIAIHHQTDGAGGRNDRGLGVAEAMRLPQSQSLIPSRFRQGNQRLVRAVAMIQRDRIDVQPLISASSVSRRPVVADHPQHRGRVAGIARESPQFPRHLGRGCIGNPGHQGGQRAA